MRRKGGLLRVRNSPLCTNGRAERIPPSKCSNRRGFTLLELLIAIVLLVTAMTIIFTTFTSTLLAWRRGQEAADDLHHGDFVMEQIVASLRSAVFFPATPGLYGFWLESRGNGDYPADEFSWVSTGTALMAVDSVLAIGMHRMILRIEDDADGKPALAVKSFLPYANLEKAEESKFAILSDEIRGISCRIYDKEDDSWDTSWKDTNSLPQAVEITLYMEPLVAGEEPVKLRRLVEIPVALSLTQAVTTIGLKK